MNWKHLESIYKQDKSSALRVVKHLEAVILEQLNSKQTKLEGYK